MARKKSVLCWDDVPDLWSPALKKLGLFVPDACQVIEVEGEGVQWATIMADSEGRSLTLAYEHETPQLPPLTVRAGVALDEIKRGLGNEIVFRCPSCDRRCNRLALLRRGVVCCVCGPVVAGSRRESRCARLARKATHIAEALELESWVEQPTRKPRGMRLRQYLSLLERRQRVICQIGEHLASRKQLRGANRNYVADLRAALGRE